MIIEELSDAEDILAVAVCQPVDVVATASDMFITKPNIIDALLSANDGLSQSWKVDSGASFHVTPLLESFASYTARSFGKVYLGNNHAFDIEGVGTVNLVLENGQELTLHNVRYVLAAKRVYYLLDS